MRPLKRDLWGNNYESPSDRIWKVIKRLTKYRPMLAKDVIAVSKKIADTLCRKPGNTVCLTSIRQKLCIEFCDNGSDLIFKCENVSHKARQNVLAEALEVEKRKQTYEDMMLPPRYSVLKSGVRGWKLDIPPYTALCTCSRCGFISTPKKVMPREDIRYWNREDKKDFLAPDMATLCMGCYNKVKIVVKREREVVEVSRLLNQLNKEIRSERKNIRNQNDRRTSRLSSEHAVGS